MREFSAADLIKAFTYKQYPLKTGIMELNIFGIRNSDTAANSFDDIVGIIYKDIYGITHLVTYEATTDPGLYARQNPMNQDGTAIIVPGHHKDCYKKGLHKGEAAMEQIAPMIYVRDANKNKLLDFLYKTTGWKSFKQNGKTNIHRAGANSIYVDKWSYGCQVFKKEASFLQFLKIVDDSIKQGQPNVFSYTLFELEAFDADTQNDTNYF